jgi:hypothetical protein
MLKKNGVQKNKLSLNKKAVAAFAPNAVNAHLIKGGGISDITSLLSSVKQCTTHSNTNWTDWTDTWKG